MSQFLLFWRIGVTLDPQNFLNCDHTVLLKVMVHWLFALFIRFWDRNWKVSLVFAVELFWILFIKVLAIFIVAILLLLFVKDILRSEFSAKAGHLLFNFVVFHDFKLLYLQTYFWIYIEGKRINLLPWK